MKSRNRIKDRHVCRAAKHLLTVIYSGSFFFNRKIILIYKMKCNNQKKEKEREKKMNNDERKNKKRRQLTTFFCWYINSFSPFMALSIVQCQCVMGVVVVVVLECRCCGKVCRLKHNSAMTSNHGHVFFTARSRHKERIA